MLDRNTPILVGVGQVNGDSGAEEPLDLIQLAVERALEDAGVTALPLDLVALSKIGTKAYSNAPGRLRDRLGVPDARTLQANHGGHTSQILLGYAATEIAEGRSRAALIAGGELGSLLKKGVQDSDTGTPQAAPFASPEADGHPDLAMGDDLYQWLLHPQEAALGIAEPIQLYPLMDTALGAALGRKREEHLAEVSRLWARFSEIAAKNPYAADQTGYSAEQIATASPTNRYVGYPYTKLMNSNQFVDQAAALLLCSVGVARDLGISSDRWVFPHAGVTAHSPFVSERGQLHDVPALTAAGSELEQLLGRPIPDVEWIDLYACFPFAVQAQARALGLDPGRDLTLTGGMRFGGGPWNNYGTHMIANLTLKLREHPEAMAVCSTNGGLATRFCLMAYSGRARDEGFRMLPYPLADPTPRRRLEAHPRGTGKIEAYTAMHDRGNQPTRGIAACLLDDGARAWALLDDAEDLESILTNDPIGRRVRFGDAPARIES